MGPGIIDENSVTNTVSSSKLSDKIMDFRWHEIVNTENYKSWWFHNSHNASDKYPTMHHFVTEMCTGVHISVTKWCIVG